MTKHFFFLFFCIGRCCCQATCAILSFFLSFFPPSFLLLPPFPHTHPHPTCFLFTFFLFFFSPPSSSPSSPSAPSFICLCLPLAHIPMADESVLQPPEGLFFDELSKIRFLDPEKGQQTEELKEQCQIFVDSAWE